MCFICFITLLGEEIGSGCKDPKKNCLQKIVNPNFFLEDTTIITTEDIRHLTQNVTEDEYHEGLFVELRVNRLVRYRYTIPQPTSHIKRVRSIILGVQTYIHYTYGKLGT